MSVKTPMCPQCKSRPMHVNHTFRSVPVYVCGSYGEGYGSCSYVISVTEYEIELGESTRKERINRRLENNYYGNAAMASSDIEYLLSRLEIAEKALERYANLHKLMYDDAVQGELYENWWIRQSEHAVNALKQIRE